jgi:hypothetical protein
MICDGFMTEAEAAQRPFTLSDGTTAHLPLCGYEGEMMSAAFTVDTEQARAMLPGRDLVPIRVTPSRSLLVISAVEYRRKSIAPYREFLVTLPVRERGAPNLPLLSAMLLERLPGFAVYLTHVGVTTNEALRIGWDLLGYPKFLADVAFDEDLDERRCVAAEGGQAIFSLSVRKPTSLALKEQRFALYSLGPRDRRRYRVEYASRAWEHTGLLGARLELGAHPVADELRELGLSTTALAVRYAPQLSLITHVPDPPVEVFGHAESRSLYRGETPARVA